MARPTPLLLLTAFVLPVLAQGEVTSAATQPPILQLKTVESGMLLDLAHDLGYVDNLPGLEAGSHYVLTVGSDRVPSVRIESGEVRYIELSVDPGGLMELFADEIGEVKGLIQGIGVMAMTQQGFSAKEAAKTLRAVFDFPYMLENATLVLVSDPRDVQTMGLEVEVSITAKADNAFGKALAQVRPAKAGVPVIPPAADRAMDIRMSLDPAALESLLEPFLEFGLSFSYPDPDSRKAAKDTWARMSGMYDGGIAMTIANDMQMEALYGFRDVEALTGLLASEDYLAMMRSQRPSRDIEVEVKTDALSYRDTTFLLMTMYNDGIANPMMPDGEMHNYIGGIGKFMILGGSEERAKRLVDAVADGKIEREPIADGAVLAIDMDLRRWFEAMRMGKVVIEDMPTRMSVVMIPKGRTLLTKIKAK